MFPPDLNKHEMLYPSVQTSVHHKNLYMPPTFY